MCITIKLKKSFNYMLAPVFVYVGGKRQTIGQKI